MHYYKSPIFYMGNKHELLGQLLDIFPSKIDTFYDLFGGSGVVSLNVKANKTVYNELNHNIVELLKVFKNNKPKTIVNHILKRIKEFDLPTSGTDIRSPDISKNTRDIENKKYQKFRKFYNSSKRNYLDLLVLTYFSFSNMIRFNQKSELNIPFGNRCFIKDEHSGVIEQACYKIQKENIEIVSKDALKILKETDFKKNDFIYLDPPYTNTLAIYNESRAFGGWGIENDLKLFSELDNLTKKGIKWCLSNVKENKGTYNVHIMEWAKKNNYRVVGMNKNYYSLGKGNANSYEICVINYNYGGDGFKVFQESLF